MGIPWVALLVEEAMPNPAVERLCVGALGGGAFGTSLCVHCSRAGHDTLMYTRDAGADCLCHAKCAYYTHLLESCATS